MFPLEQMGETAENVYEMSRSGQIKGGEITRTEQDRFALQSQVRAIQAINHGYFKREIIPVSQPIQAHSGVLGMGIVPQFRGRGLGLAG